jgi:hypothetical protein
MPDPPDPPDPPDLPDLPDLPWHLLVQPDQSSCGATVLVVARMLGDPAYDALVEGGGAARFRSEVLAMHRRITGVADISGRAQLPWPQALGTPPWAVARQLSGTRASDGSQATYTWHLARTNQAVSWDRLVAAAGRGRVSAVYLGSTWLPRHVTLVVAAAGGTLQVYDPARGQLVAVSRDSYVANRVGVAGWDTVWLDVTPDTTSCPRV